jgi:hypothetical protein
MESDPQAVRVAADMGQRPTKKADVTNWRAQLAGDAHLFQITPAVPPPRSPRYRSTAAAKCVPLGRAGQAGKRRGVFARRSPSGPRGPLRPALKSRVLSRALEHQPEHPGVAPSKRRRRCGCWHSRPMREDRAGLEEPRQHGYIGGSVRRPRSRRLGPQPRSVRGAWLGR